ncbi:hypothetical protein AAC387_Pa03g0317 [Persea americana]
MEGEKREILHQRRSLPCSTMQMAVAAIGYFTLYTKAKPEASAAAVAKATTSASGDDRKRQSKFIQHPAEVSTITTKVQGLMWVDGWLDFVDWAMA